ncbi:MAG: tetratricopeptide repeat protein, partial [bacterium]|nr:tetratricopeptide repeat protein [bacterium]
PINIVITVFLAFTLFGDKDLGRVSQEITLQDETGKQIQRTIPKTRFRKKVALFFFKNLTGDKSLDWLQYGLNQMLEYDINQDMFVDTVTPYTIGPRSVDPFVYREMKEAGYKDGLGLPLLLKKKIAKDARMDYFSSGNLSRQGDQFILENRLYRTKDAKLEAKSEIRGKNIFKLVDDLSVQLRHDLEIPTGHIKKVTDLPLADSFTHSLSAARLYTLSSNSMFVETDWKQAEHYLDKAINEDPTFAMAYLQRIFVYILTNQSKKWGKSIKPMMRLVYKLPERDQYYWRDGYFQLKGERDQAIAQMEIFIKLYPEDLRAYYRLLRHYDTLNRRDDVIATYKRILEIDPQRFEVFADIARQYEDKGDSKEALNYYERYALHFPQNPRSFELLGRFHKGTGNFEKAKEYYKKALVLEPENIPMLTRLATIEKALGNFDKASRQLHDALESCHTSREKVMVYSELKDFYSAKGQKVKALEYLLLKDKALQEYASPLEMAFSKLNGITDFAATGKEKEAFQVLDALKVELKDSKSIINLSNGYVVLYLALGKPDEAEKSLRSGFEDDLTETGKKGKNGFWLNARARIHHLRGEYQVAIQRYREYLKLNPTLKGIQLRLGQCYRQLKDYQKAEEHMKAVLKTYPFSPSTHYELGLLYLDRGNKTKALEHFKVAADVWKDADPDFTPAKKAKEKLAQLRE